MAGTPEVIRQMHEMLAQTLSPVDEQRKPAEEYLRKNEAVRAQSLPRAASDLRAKLLAVTRVRRYMGP